MGDRSLQTDKSEIPEAERAFYFTDFKEVNGI